MDDILGSKPEIIPIATCSSFATSSSSSSSVCTVDSETPEKRIRKTEKTESKGEARERRHKERIQMQGRLLEVLERGFSTLDKLADKLQ